MATNTSSGARPQRGPWLKRGLLILIPLLLVAVIWDGLRSMLAPKPRPDFTATTLQGKDWSLASYRGKKPVILNFFATWCGPCKQELPRLVEIQQKHQASGVELVIITREPADVVKQFPEFSELPVTLITDGGAIFDEYQVDAIPHTLYFDQGGKLAFEVQGYNEVALGDLEKRL